MRMVFIPPVRLGDDVFNDVAEVYFSLVEVFGAVIQILRVYKNADTLAFVFNDCHTNDELSI